MDERHERDVRIGDLEAQLAQVVAQWDDVRNECAEMGTRLAQAEAERDDARSARTRIAADLDGARDERDVARAEVDAYRRRLVVRMVERSPLTAGWRFLRSKATGR
jgi:uncharacterized protein (DUF3084 family)